MAMGAAFAAFIATSISCAPAWAQDPNTSTLNKNLNYHGEPHQAPAIGLSSIYGLNPCSTGATLGVSTPLFGIGGAISNIDKDCETRNNAAVTITALQDVPLAREILCNINVDVVGSGSAMTAEVLLDALGIKATIEHERQINGIEELKRGDIAAVIHIGGVPIPLFANVPAGSGLHFLSVPLGPALAKTYLPDQFTHDIYPALVPVDAPVPTIAVGDVMAVFAWQPHSDRYNNVARFVDAFFSRFKEFQQPPRHPKWREVSLAAEVPGWVRFQPAQDWLAQQAVARNSETQARFGTFLSQVAPQLNGQLTPAAKASLFQQFQAWTRQGATASR